MMNYNLFKQRHKYLAIIMVIFLSVACVNNTKEIPNSNKNINVYGANELGNSFTDTIRFSKENNITITGISLNIKGDINGRAKILISHPPYDSYLKEIIFSDSIDYQYDNDWYEKELLIKYEPIDSIKNGELKIRYKFKHL